MKFAPLSRWLLCFSLLLVVAGCASPGPKLAPDDDVVVDGIYENRYFSFTLPIPDSWHIADVQALESMLDAKETSGKAGKIDYLLLVVSEYPVGTATDSNPSFSIGADHLSRYRAVSSGQDYLTQLADGLSEQSSGGVEVYEYQLDAKPFYRLDLVVDTEIGPIRQSYIAMASKEYVLNFVLTGKTKEDIDALETILDAGYFGALSEEVTISGRTFVSPAQGVLGLLLVALGAGLVALSGWLKRRKAVERVRDEGKQGV